MKIEENYLDRSICDSVKGIFILTVFFSHIMPYLKRQDVFLADPITHYLGVGISMMAQLIVVMFLFYSGYGIMFSILKKGDAYVSAMPRARLWRTLLNFMVAVTLFLILQTIVLGKSYSIQHILLSFIGWESVGNSNWYIFVILLCYGITWLIFSKLKWGGVDIKLWTTVIFTLVLIVPLVLTRGSWWSDTLAAYPFGMIWCRYKNSIDGFVRKYWIQMFIVALAAMALYFKIPFSHTTYALFHNVRSVFFAFLIVLITMVVPLNIPILAFFGRNLFPIYIYQRLPMLFLSEFDGGVWMSSHPYSYLAACFAITIAIVPIYNLKRFRVFKTAPQ